MCYATWDNINCFSKNHRHVAKSKIAGCLSDSPSLCLWTDTEHSGSSSRSWDQSPVALTVRGEKSVLICLRVTRSFGKSLLKILMIILILSFIFPYISNFIIAPDAALQLGTPTPIFFPRKELFSRLILWNSARICTYLPLPAKWKPIKPVVFGTCPFWYAPATSQFIISNNFQC